MTDLSDFRGGAFPSEALARKATTVAMAIP